MSANHSRKLFLAALLAVALAAPASASDGQPTAQMAQIGQSAPDMVAMDNGATITETSQIPNKASMSEPVARQKVTDLRPSVVRQPVAGRHVPLMLGIGY
jgi:hypothetical protein